MKHCPFCAEQIQDAAVICRYCQRDLPALPQRESSVIPGIVVDERPVADATVSGVQSGVQPKTQQRLAMQPMAVAAIVVGITVVFFFVGTAGLDWLNGGTIGGPSARVTEQASARIDYEVNGEDGARSASLTYQSAPGSTQQEESVQLPWSKQIDVTNGQFLYISAQNKSSSGCVNVRITQGAIVLKQARSCGEYVIATASTQYSR